MSSIGGASRDEHIRPVPAVERTFYTFDETIAKLRLDEESFRQALQYQLQAPNDGQWMRAVVVITPPLKFLARVTGNLVTESSPAQQGSALSADGFEIPPYFSSSLCGWHQAGSSLRSGYSVVYEIDGAFVVRPSDVREIASRLVLPSWEFKYPLSVAPLSFTADGAYPDIEFSILNPTSPRHREPDNVRHFMFVAEDVDALANKTTAVVTRPVSGQRWPWGNYETAALSLLAAAAEKFWTLYDPSEPSTAPNNEQIEAWLKDEHKVSARLASSIASILRADGLKTGPRK